MKNKITIIKMLESKLKDDSLPIADRRTFNFGIMNNIIPTIPNKVSSNIIEGYIIEFVIFDLSFSSFSTQSTIFGRTIPNVPVDSPIRLNPKNSGGKVYGVRRSESEKEWPFEIDSIRMLVSIEISVFFFNDRFMIPRESPKDIPDCNSMEREEIKKVKSLLCNFLLKIKPHGLSLRSLLSLKRL
jgi:hypothetical protein